MNGQMDELMCGYDEDNSVLRKKQQYRQIESSAAAVELEAIFFFIPTAQNQDRLLNPFSQSSFAGF